MGQLITVTKSMKLYAKYKKKVYNIHVGAVPSFAIVQLKNKDNTETLKYEHGDTCYITVDVEKPNTIKTFNINGTDRKADLVATETDQATTYKLEEVMTSNRDVTITFADSVMHSITASVSAGKGYVGIKDKSPGVTIAEVKDGGSYIIAIDPYGSEVLESVTLNGTNITDRFFDDQDALINEVTIQNVTEDQVVVVAFSQPNEHLVEYFDINSEKLSEERVAHGDSITTPDAPAVEGYDFLEWEERP